MNINQLTALRTLRPTSGTQSFRDGRILKALFRRGFIYNLRLTAQGRILTKRANTELGLLRMVIS